ncbi:alpha/beta fold hydrolase [Helicobacter bilis]|uniref:alpha/beta fold hydrolase n=1 Tax=Helicobacter bilis TaxID=37372 RepID=UPI0010FE54F6|nr:alpha/beta fold hydrolase [Helicobacter bilis]TLE02559.1 hypothetical protein LS76_011245 [Helicobacter bilis]
MNNKQRVKKIRDYAELAQVSYFYFDLLKDSNGIPRKIYELDSNGNKIKDEKYPRGYKEIEVTLEHIVNKKYQGQEVLINLQQGDDIFTEMKNSAKEVFNFDKLNGEFGEIQTQRFFERYDLLKHCPNTESNGFSATFFYNKESKEYTLAFRGTEFKLDQIQDLINDYYIGTNNDDLDKVVEQYFDMLFFYEETLKPLMQEKGITKINVVGHSLGGYLTQLFALSYPNIINEVYTYNAPLESRSVA